MKKTKDIPTPNIAPKRKKVCIGIKFVSKNHYLVPLFITFGFPFQ